MTSVRRRLLRPTGPDTSPSADAIHRPLPHPRDDAADTAPVADEASGVGRRGFLSWAIAAPTLMVGTSLVATSIDAAPAAATPLPPVPEPADEYDLEDAQTDSAMPTANLITITVDSKGVAHFALPRQEVGQGTTTSTTMIIAEEMDLPMSKVQVTLADARPELIFNQLTGGSNSANSTFTPIRLAAALAKSQLTAAAAKKWGVEASSLTTSEGVVRHASGKSATYGELAGLAAASKTHIVRPALKDPSQWTILGTPQNRVDALQAVTGRKVFTLDLKIPGTLPTMIARSPTLLGTPKQVLNTSAVLQMPGVTDVAMIASGVAVRAATFGQCIDAIRALKVKWTGGTEDGKSDATLLQELAAAELPLGSVPVPPLATTIEQLFTFYFRSNSPLETGCCVAKWSPNGIETWSPEKAPIALQEDLCTEYGFLPEQVTVHCNTGGGSFGRHLFSDAAKEAVAASKAFGGKGVRLMWSRTDDFRVGRVKSMATSRVRMSYIGNEVLTYEQVHTGIATDFSHGLGEIVTAVYGRLPPGEYTLAQGIWVLTQTVSYDYGVTAQLLNETDQAFRTGAMRNVYSPDSRTAQELMTDMMAKQMGMDRMAFRQQFVKDPRGLAVLQAVASAGQWGRSLPKGMAQGIAVHNEYKAWVAVLTEIDNTPATVNRQVENGYTGPRVTRVTLAVDNGLPLNPRGLEAQMQGGIMDGIAQALTSSLHFKNGYFLEGSWDNYFYTREWNVPPEINVIIMPPTSDTPGGAGELGVGSTMASVACAYGAATGVTPTFFPINHLKSPSHFDVIPTRPSTPQSPTDGLDYAY